MGGEILVVRHDDYELLGGIESCAVERRRRLREAAFYRGDAPRAAARDDRIIIMGGTMSANDDAVHPWIPAEKRWIAEAIAAGARVLGICLGAQLLASVLGGQVTRNPHREIGWFPVVRVDPPSVMPSVPPPSPPPSRLLARPSFARAIPEAHLSFLWHCDTFAIPPGAIRLARSGGCANQAFAWGDRVAAVQFHPEMTPEGARAIVENSPQEIVPGPYVQDPRDFVSEGERYERLSRVMGSLMDWLDGDGGARGA